MGDMLIVAYRPKPGKENALLALTRDHVPELRRLGLATRSGLDIRYHYPIVDYLNHWAETGDRLT